MPHPAPYTAHPLTEPDGLVDVRIQINGKTWHLWGRKGQEREQTLAATVEPGRLPVLIGAGLGHCLRSLAALGGPVAVVDRETSIEKITGVRRQMEEHPAVTWVDDGEPQAVLDRLQRWRAAHGHAPPQPMIIPLYQRLDPAYYGSIAHALKAEAKADFRAEAAYPKFRSKMPRVLFLDSSYFLCGEIVAALARLDTPHRTLPLGRTATGSTRFIEDLLHAVLDFRPDFVLTVNHFGLDREGRLAGLLAELGLPLASWFVDNPALILHDYAHPGADNTAVFTFDAGNLAMLRSRGFARVQYLPLATDPERFRPGLGTTAPPQWAARVSFVGNSMAGPVARTLEIATLPEAMRDQYPEVAAEFGASGQTDVRGFLLSRRPDWRTALDELPTPERRLALESLLTWEATRQYRLACVRSILGFSPLIVGDEGWLPQLGRSNDWRRLSPLDYYADLPRFYPLSEVSLNCTSRQMAGAVNQRVFDVPACGGFVLTDRREQMDDLFEPGTEVIAYDSPDEIPALTAELLADPARRENVSSAARARILAEHTYDLRLRTLLAAMRETFGG
ncbi:glycosyltransferase [Pseudodesulfovibrio sp. F-1]|uniref:Glycosyltransferase n=1 Tax=Pseudodesulfovibrio alkaliphilus TaxID=2661613 RepID=A0A7K1KJ91_9BACT|nr:glycosyltransferase [Pseudodesulfovibrio alkaliphilus]MUM76126.1 glycosyltransferase [Pseudodesulfovibrio alkaliphilus]